MDLRNITFESDSLQGLDKHANWRARDKLKKGRDMPTNHPLWFCQHVHRSNNGSAHNLAQWAKRNDFCGVVDIASLPSFIFCNTTELSNDFVIDSVCESID